MEGSTVCNNRKPTGVLYWCDSEYESYDCDWHADYWGLKALAKHLATKQRVAFKYGEIDQGIVAVLAEALRATTTLKKLKLEGNFLSHEGINVLGRALACNGSIIKLDLKLGRKSSEVIRVLAERLHDNTALRRLDLSDNKLGSEGAKAIAVALRNNTFLERLALRWNTIGEEGAKALADVLGDCPSLRRLDLKRNKINDQGAQAIIQATGPYSRFELDLRWNNISQDGVGTLYSAASCHDVTLEVNCKAKPRRGAKNHKAKNLKFQHYGVLADENSPQKEETEALLVGQDSSSEEDKVLKRSLAGMWANLLFGPPPPLTIPSPPRQRSEFGYSIFPWPLFFEQERDDLWMPNTHLHAKGRNLFFKHSSVPTNKKQNTK